MARLSIVLLDKPSMGLAPRVVHEISELVRELYNRDGVTFFVAEQNTNMALQHAHRG